MIFILLCMSFILLCNQVINMMYQTEMSRHVHSDPRESDVCVQRRFKSACVSVKSDQSSLSMKKLCFFGYPKCAQLRARSDCANAYGACTPYEDLDQPAHSRSLVRIAWCILDSQGCKVSSCGQRRLWSDCADAQADLSLRCAQISECTLQTVYLCR